MSRKAHRQRSETFALARYLRDRTLAVVPEGRDKSLLPNSIPRYHPCLGELFGRGGNVSSNWYVQVNGKARPCTREEIHDLLLRGILDAESLVWTEGLAEWIPYRDSTLANPGATVTPPPPPSPPDVSPAIPLPTMAAPALTTTSTQPTRDTLVSMPEPPALEVSDDGWQDVRPAPWRRWFARMFDLFAMGAVAWALLAIVVASVSTSLYDSLFASSAVTNPFMSQLFTCLLVIPLAALLVGLTGSSLGKWIFGVRVTRRDGRPIGIKAAALRELEVFAAGMGLGIPIIIMITEYRAYSRLKSEGATSWDDGRDWVVTHRPQNAWQAVLYLVGGVSLLVMIVALQAMTK